MQARGDALAFLCPLVVRLGSGGCCKGDQLDFPLGQYINDLLSDGKTSKGTDPTMTTSGLRSRATCTSSSVRRCHLFSPKGTGPRP